MAPAIVRVASCSSCCLLQVLTFLLLLQLLSYPHHASAQAQQPLSATFYSTTCPSLQAIVHNVMAQAVFKEARIAASILRLFFHDCFVQGCDASLLLDDVPGFQGEKTAGPNANSARGFDVIDNIKTQVEAACKGIVSCADILALAAREGVVLQNGPNWNVLLGRRDSKTASFSDANNNLPGPASTLSQLITKFQAQNLSVTDMVALSGAHTIGQARCISFKQRLYDQDGTGQADPTLDPAYLALLKGKCPASGGDNNLSPLDLWTPIVFDKQYFVNLQGGKGLLNSDQVLFSTNDSLGSFTKSLVTNWASNQNTFYSAFTSAIVKMGNLNPLTGTAGEIRVNCRLRN